MNILILKVGALGDVLRTTFIAQALKDKYLDRKPKIYWITDDKARAIFNNNPYVDYLASPKNKNKLKNIGFELVINLEEDIENCIYSSSLNARRIIGFYHKDGEILPTESAKEWFDMSRLGKKPENDLLKRKNRKTHRQIIGEMVGVNWKRYEPFIRLDEKQRNIRESFLKKHKLSENELIIGINTGSADTWPKSLPVNKTVKLIQKINADFNAKIILFGGPEELERNKEILRMSKVPIIDAGCDNSLFEFPALVSVCRAVITTDSLGLHVSLALKRKTLCLMGPTSSAEIDMYGLGEKIVSKSKCLCCYKKNCKSMNKIDNKAVIDALKRILKQRICVVITAFKEPSIEKAVKSALNQKTGYDYDLVVAAPDKETLSRAERISIKYPNFKKFMDPGKGKSYALNILFKKLNHDILILTDGDVFMNEMAVEKIGNAFLNPLIGCVTGRPVPIERKSDKYGYWANFLFDAAHIIRLRAAKNHKFIECSGYLFGFRKNKIYDIPLDVAEDTIIPYYFWEKGYEIGYADKAEAYVKNPSNWRDWIKQKTRTSKAHETLNKYVNTSLNNRVKSFRNESRGGFLIISYPKNISEFLWSIELAFARLYMWARVHIETKLMGKNYGDAWERVESTK